MARRAALRASDFDRERIAERLRHATGEGRLLAEELEERLGRALSARTYGELDALVADLPREEQRRTLRQRAALAVAVAGVILLVVAAVAAVLLLLTGVAVGFVWVALGWWFLSCRRHAYCGRRRVYGARRF